MRLVPTSQTTDWLAVNPGGEIDDSLTRTLSLGIQSVLADFEESFRSNNLEVVMDTPVPPPQRVRKPHIAGIFEGGGKKYPCEQEIHKSSRKSFTARSCST